MDNRLPPNSFRCPRCSEEVPVGARQCRSCGSSADCGWEETDAEYAMGGYDEDSDFDYDDFVEREFGTDGGPPLSEIRELRFRLVILAVLIALLLPILWGYL